MWVASYAWTSFQKREALNLGTSARETSAKSGRNTTCAPPMWNSGSHTKNTSPAIGADTSIAPSTAARSIASVTSAPFGGPVVPMCT